MAEYVEYAEDFLLVAASGDGFDRHVPAYTRAVRVQSTKRTLYHKAYSLALN